MRFTSAEAAKLLRRLNDEKSSLLARERSGAEFIAAIEEDIESVRPQYDFKATQKKLVELDEKIRTVKHALNVFNSTTVLEEFGMTIDQMLVYIPQLSERKDRYARMKDKLPKVREQAYHASGVLDYRYLNYDVLDANAEYEKTADALAKAQMALDKANAQFTLEINL